MVRYLRADQWRGRGAAAARGWGVRPGVDATRCSSGGGAGGKRRGARPRPPSATMRLLIEKYVEKPRQNIEVQVFGDGSTGGASVRARLLAHCAASEGDRGGGPRPGIRRRCGRRWGRPPCGGPRRSGIPGAGRWSSSWMAQRGCGPTGSWFKGMKHAPAVEHPVTEGDHGGGPGVEWQLRVGRRGTPCPAGRRIWAIDGHAFEARLYGGGCAQGLPARDGAAEPTCAFRRARGADTGVRAGDEISPGTIR